MAKLKAPRTEDGLGPDCSRIMENLRTLARMARAAEIILIWATQKPTMDGKSPGARPADQRTDHLPCLTRPDDVVRGAGGLR
ncbi:hypothetical protein OG930_24275 [Streptomyces sp. NBC_01799]|nr:hypothetical protein OG930_24275 [Streptomyces sp. NBC_01799]